MSHFSEEVDTRVRVNHETLEVAIAAATVLTFGHGSCGHRYDCDCLTVQAETREATSGQEA